MASIMKVEVNYLGMNIYQSANTHPYSKTKSYAVIYCAGTKIKRFRYKVALVNTRHTAYCDAKKFIETLTAPATDTGK